jgi:hypothetical protein
MSETTRVGGDTLPAEALLHPTGSVSGTFQRGPDAWPIGLVLWISVTFGSPARQ